MTNEQIIQIAREAGLASKQYHYDSTDEIEWQALERFATLVAAAEADRIANESKHIIKRAEERGAAAERADAERYRWLRDNNASFSWNPSRYNQETISGFAAFGTGYCGFEFEAAVDKAMGSNND